MVNQAFHCITEKELERMLQLSRTSIWKLRQEGMPFYRLGFRSIRYRIEEVEAFLRTRTVQEQSRRHSNRQPESFEGGGHYENK